MKNLLLFLLLSSAAWGQSFFRLPQPFPNSTMNVCPVPSGGNPCPSPVNIYQDQGLTQLIPQPVNIGATGNIGFWVSNTVSQFTVQIHAPYNQEFIIGGGGGGGGVPGGSPNQLQLNNAGVFGGLANVSPPSPLVSSSATTAPVFLQGITYATTAQNWSQTGITTSLTGCPTGVACATQTLTLNAGFVGIDVSSGWGYQVYINDGANSEAVNVTGGTYTFGAGGTITFVPFFNHGPSAYTVGSASSGIQETVNAACGTSSTHYFNIWCNVTIPATLFPIVNTYNIQGTIFLHTNESILSGYGASLLCMGRGPCLQVGSRTSSNDFVNNTVRGLSFRSPTDFSAIPAYAGVQITNTVRTTQVVTITTATAHGFRPGDLVTILFTDQASYWGDAVVTTVPTATSFTYSHTGADIASLATPGVVALAYEAVLDNGGNSHFAEISYDLSGSAGHFNNFFDMWDDENAAITKFNNNAISLFTGPNWTGSFIFSAGNQGSLNQIAPVITFRDSNITANSSNGVTVYNSNGIYIDNTVIQASGPWQVYSANTTGNFQGAVLRNIYPESSLNANPNPSISGSVTSGVFQLGEKVIQATTGASAYTRNAPVGSGGMILSAIVGTPDNSHTWTGQTSAAVYTPTTTPAGWKSPFYGLGIAGLIAGPSSGAAVFSVSGGGGVQGLIPTGGAGATAISYWIVAHDTTLGTQTSPMRVLDWSSTGTDLIPVAWPRIANGTDTITYDVIRSATPVGNGGVFPYNGGCGGGAGTTCGSVATGITQATACSGTLQCVFQDTASVSTSAYTINQGTYVGNLLFWPGTIVSSASTVSVEVEQGPVNAAGLNGNPIQSAKRCNSVATASAGGYSVCMGGGTTNSVPNQTATLLTDGGAAGGGMTLSKGRLNFNMAPGAILQPHHIITLIDSQPALTRATNAFRPPASSTDTWIGTDVAPAGVTVPNGQLAFGSPVSISNYIGATGDGTTQNWLERLTASLKVMNVNLQMAANKAIDLVEGTAPSGSAGHDFIWGDSTAHRVMINPNNIGAFMVPGVAAAGTSGHLAVFATNGIDLIDGGAPSGGGTVTSSGPPSATQCAFFTTATNITGTTDCLINTTGTHSMTVPVGAGTVAGLQFAGQSGAGFTAGVNGINVLPRNTIATNGLINLSYFNGTSYVSNFQTQTSSTGTSLISLGANLPVGLGAAFTSTGGAALALGNTSAFTATSGTQVDIHVGADTFNGATFGANFAPTSGTAEFRVLALNPTINQTGGANGIIRVLAAHPLNTALIGTEYCLSLGTAASGAPSAALTDKFTIECGTGNTISQGSITATTSVKGATYLTATNCTANGTAANPSVVSCSAAAAGAFSCDVAASAGTCTVNTTAVTANSEIAVHLNSYTGTRLTVTCNTAPTAIPAIYVASIVAGTSFTINMPTITTNPACFDYTIVN